MGVRFGRPIRLAPGIRLNLSKSGISTSIGRCGAWLTPGPARHQGDGRPATGISYTTTSSAYSHAHHSSQPSQPHGQQYSRPAQPRSVGPVAWLVIAALLLVIVLGVQLSSG